VCWKSSKSVREAESSEVKSLELSEKLSDEECRAKCNKVK